MMKTKTKKTYPAIITLAAIALLATMPSTTRSFDESDVEDAIQRAKDYQGQIKTENKNTEQMSREAQKSYGDYQKRSDEVQMWQDRIDYDGSKVFVKEKPEPNAPPTEAAKGIMLASDERIYIFISSSMPKETVENYAKSMDKLRDTRIVMVLRGCIGGCERILPTARWIQDIVAPTQDNQLVAEVIIDPHLFSFYQVEAVPTIIYAKNVKTDMDEASEGLALNLTDKPKAYSILGDVSLGYALDKMATESKTPKLAQMAKTLNENFYSR